MKLSTGLIALMSLHLSGCAGIHDYDPKDEAAGGVFTQVYPTRPVHLIEPFGEGSGPDLLARALAPHLSQLWGQPVTVENVSGAGATAGPARVAKSSGDGYTLLINSSAQAYSAAVLKNPPYDPLKDFIPIVPLSSQPYVLVAGKSAGVATVAELIEAARAIPGELRFGSSGMGTGTHLGVEKFNQATGIKALHEPADSTADTIANAIAGRVTYFLAPIAAALPKIRDGQLVALGVSTARRSKLLPDVSTIAEAGVHGFDFPIWYGIWVPAGTPVEVVDKLAKDIGQVLSGPDMSDSIAMRGGQPMNMSQPEFARFVLTESESAARIIESAGIKP